MAVRECASVPRRARVCDVAAAVGPKLRPPYPQRERGSRATVLRAIRHHVCFGFVLHTFFLEMDTLRPRSQAHLVTGTPEASPPLHRPPHAIHPKDTSAPPVSVSP